MRFYNGQLFTGEGFSRGGFEVKNGRFRRIWLEDAEQTGVDLGGARVLPGLVDIHVHGAAGVDFSDGSEEDVRIMARHLAQWGVTAFLPTAMSLPYDALVRALAATRALAESSPEGCARVLGARLEGPFLSEGRKGAQNGAYLRLPDLETFLDLQRGCGGLVKLVDVAPELPGALEFVRAVKGSCRVSAGHTNADYDQSSAFFSAGGRHVTHLFNAMPSIHHRAPGLIGAASDRQDVTTEMIADGHHVHPSAVRMAFRLFPGRLCLISDGLRCMGMGEGTYELSGQRVIMRDGVARLEDGTLAGAASNLYEDMVNAISFGVPATQAVRAATILPARVLGVDGELGSIDRGKLADFLLCDEKWGLKAVYMGGERLSLSKA